MKNILGCSAVALLMVGCATTGEENAAARTPVSGVILENFDNSVRPQDDFYRYVNGGWLKNTAIPADKSTYGAFYILRDNSEKQLKSIIEDVSGQADAKAGSDEQKVRDYYNSFMDEDAVEARGFDALKTQWDRIAATTSRDQIPALMAELSRAGVRIPLGGYVNQDDKDPESYIVYLYQSGLGLPDRDYYLEDNEKFQKVREEYVAHIERMFRLIGNKNAANNAIAIMKLETALAKAHWNRVDLRDSDKTYNKMTIAELNKAMPGFDWKVFLEKSGVRSESIVAMTPSAFEGFVAEVRKRAMPVWRTYFRFRLLTHYAPYLSKDFVEEHFAFNGKVLRGTEELRPRWKRAVQATEDALGESLGKIYVARHFPPRAKARMEELVANLIRAQARSIRDLDWMSDTTKARALEKLSKFTPKIGYPDQWRDYSGLDIRAGDLIGNVARSAQFEHDYHVSKLGKPINRDEWFMTPQTVNAYYNPNMNEIVFPAAILQPPFFNLDADDAVNYGGIGAVIAHEIGHGFDDQGSKYDGNGRLESWWSDADRAAFETRTKALIEQYNQYEPIAGQNVNGALTIGENIGDLGGATIALKAYQLSLNGQEPPVMDGFNGTQRFFIGFAQIWQALYREEALLQRIKSDPHSPAEFRCNGPLVNVDAFADAFNVREGDGMFKPEKDRVAIW